MKPIRLYWVREDRQGSINMGVFATMTDALSWIPCLRRELAEQCANEDERESVLKGTWKAIEY
jgi:hypothetical protein